MTLEATYKRWDLKKKMIVTPETGEFFFFFGYGSHWLENKMYGP